LPAQDLAKVGAAAAAVHVPAFAPRKGVHIETDPKASQTGSSTLTASHV
jgi:hypothetical protein